MIVAVTGDVLLFTAAKLAISPVPLDAKPILGVSFTQAYVVVPEVLEVVRLISSESSALHNTWFSTSSSWLEGFTVIVNIWGSPWQETPSFSNVGVTMTVATTGVFPEFDTVSDSIFPFPEAAKPILGVSFTHE